MCSCAHLTCMFVYEYIRTHPVLATALSPSLSSPKANSSRHTLCSRGGGVIFSCSYLTLIPCMREVNARGAER